MSLSICLRARRGTRTAEVASPGEVPRRRQVRSLLGVLALVSATLTTFGARTVGAAGARGAPAGAIRPAADLVATVDFEAYPVDTEITNQYSGITFEYPAAAGFTYGSPGDGVAAADTSGPPLVVADGAHSGSHAGEMGPAGEFGPAGTFVALSNLADSVSVYIGDLTLTGMHVELDAYDANRDLIGSDTAVTTATGAQTLLSYSTGGDGTIAYVAMYRSDIEDTPVAIDDLSVSMPPSTAPIVGVAAPQSSYEVGQGGSIAIPLKVTRLDGASGAVTLTVSGAPSGVSDTLAENPVAAADTTSTLTISAASSAPIGSTQLSLSASAAGSLSQAAQMITLSVVAPLQLEVPSGLDVGSCSSTGSTITAQVAPGVSGTVAFTGFVRTALTGLSASVSPSQVAINDNGVAQTRLTVSSTGGDGQAQVGVTATLNDGPEQNLTVPITELGPEITSFDAMDRSSEGLLYAGVDADTPRAEHPGTTVEISGQYFCNTATVAFGNSEATVVGTVEHELGPQGPYDYVRVTTPRLATSGPLTVTAGSPAASGASSASLSVDSYRNTDAFSFQNFDPELDFQDMVDAFGTQQTYVNVNPCGIFTLGLANCSVPIAPDPVALAELAIAQAAIASGTCFGFSLTDQRLLSGEISLDSLPRSGEDIFDLDAPSTTGSDSQRTAYGNAPILLQLKAQHLMQLSTEFLSRWGPAAAGQAIGDSAKVVSGIVGQIGQIFAAGRYPMIELQDGSEGHVVVAYDLDHDPKNGWDIYVYDSNEPFTSDEGTDGTTHAAAVKASVIHLEEDGNWFLDSTTDSIGAHFHGSQGQIVVTDPASIPLQPTLETLGGAAPGLLFSSSDPPGSAGDDSASAAVVTQVSGSGGKTLYRPDGSLDTDPKTRLQAAPFAPLVDGRVDVARLAELTWIGPSAGPIAVTTRGARSGAMAETLVQRGLVASVETSTVKGAEARASFSTASDSVGFDGSTHSSLSLSLDRTSSAGTESVQITTAGSSSGEDTLALTPGGAVSIGHSGAATTLTVTLSGTSRSSLPTRFTSGPIRLAAGEGADLSAIGWTSLTTSSPTLQIGKRLVRLRNELGRPVRLVSVSRLRVLPSSQRRIDLVVTGSLSALPASRQVTVLWVLREGRHVVSSHDAVVSVRKRTFSTGWATRLPRASLTWSAVVLAVAGTGASTEGGAATASLKLPVR